MFQQKMIAKQYILEDKDCIVILFQMLILVISHVYVQRTTQSFRPIFVLQLSKFKSYIGNIEGFILVLILNTACVST